MLSSPRKNGLTSLFKEVRVLKVAAISDIAGRLDLKSLALWASKLRSAVQPRKRAEYCFESTVSEKRTH